MKVIVHVSAFIAAMVEVEIEPDQVDISVRRVSPIKWADACAVMSNSLVGPSLQAELSKYATHRVLKEQTMALSQDIEANHAKELLKQNEPEGGAQA